MVLQRSFDGFFVTAEGGFVVDALFGDDCVALSCVGSFTPLAEFGKGLGLCVDGTGVWPTELAGAVLSGTVKGVFFEAVEGVGATTPGALAGVAFSVFGISLRFSTEIGPALSSGAGIRVGADAEFSVCRGGEV